MQEQVWQVVSTGAKKGKSSGCLTSRRRGMKCGPCTEKFAHPCTKGVDWQRPERERQARPKMEVRERRLGERSGERCEEQGWGRNVYRQRDATVLSKVTMLRWVM
ncbi:hypothetical protein E2C01_089159 [Portunus trituberculatus]|uniref:Uncharacterized protein n=1 Tax=Portunus trituberculatus TaxID=210409 RepID=A0A5B7JGH7_PORTR|nr:hypothetical protein [Portunus trituberculatus]